MIVLDHDIPRDQADLLRRWRIHFRQIGIHVGRPEWDDQQEVLRFLRRTRGVTFFTRDFGFYRPRFRHKHYCIAVVDQVIAKTAWSIHSLLRHRDFRTKAMRSGLVVKLSPSKISVWKVGVERQYTVRW